MTTPTIHRRMNAGDWTILAALSLSWGCAFFFLAIGSRELPPFTLVLARVGCAALVLLGWALVARLVERAGPINSLLVTITLPVVAILLGTLVRVGRCWPSTSPAWR